MSPRNFARTYVKARSHTVRNQSTQFPLVRCGSRRKRADRMTTAEDCGFTYEEQMLCCFCEVTPDAGESLRAASAEWKSSVPCSETQPPNRTKASGADEYPDSRRQTRGWMRRTGGSSPVFVRKSNCIYKYIVIR